MKVIGYQVTAQVYCCKGCKILFTDVEDEDLSHTKERMLFNMPVKQIRTEKALECPECNRMIDETELSQSAVRLPLYRLMEN